MSRDSWLTRAERARIADVFRRLREEEEQQRIELERENERRDREHLPRVDRWPPRVHESFVLHGGDEVEVDHAAGTLRLTGRNGVVLRFDPRALAAFTSDDPGRPAIHGPGCGVRSGRVRRHAQRQDRRRP